MVIPDAHQEQHTLLRDDTGMASCHKNRPIGHMLDDARHMICLLIACEHELGAGHKIQTNFGVGGEGERREGGSTHHRHRLRMGQVVTAGRGYRGAAPAVLHAAVHVVAFPFH
jgi:hypothetical protein